MKKVLITGNRNYGLCEAICNLFDTVDDISYRTISRGNGYNLDSDEDQKRLAELFVEEKKWEFKSGSSDKVYTVKHNKRGELSCDCMGYIGHRKCKHITVVKESL